MLEESHRAHTTPMEKAWKIPCRGWTGTNTLMTHKGQEMGSAGDTKAGQLSVSSPYNGSLGEHKHF